MIKERFIIPTIILVFICFLFGLNTSAQLETGIEDFEQLMQSNPSKGLTDLAQNPAPDTFPQYPGSGQIIEVTPASTGSLSSGVQLQNIVGSTRVALLGGHIVGGMIISSVNDHALPAFNPLTGDVIVYNMDAGDSVVIDYAEGPAYRAKMSEGVEAELQTENRIRFTAYGKDSVLKIKPTEEPSYEFNNGLLEYESDKVLEQINTTEENEASVDADYRYGFKCLTIAPDADYNYLDKNDDFRSFRVRNNNKKDYQVCLEKTAYDEYEQTGDFYSLFNIQDGYAKLKAAVNFEKEDQTVYEGMDRFNVAELSFDRIKKVASFSLTNVKSANGILSKIYTGYHIITEERQGKVVKRYHQFSKEKHPSIIKEYSSDLRFSKLPDVKIEDDVLVQEGKNKFTALSFDTVKFGVCEDLLEKALEYKGGGDEFDEKC